MFVLGGTDSLRFPGAQVRVRVRIRVRVSCLQSLLFFIIFMLKSRGLMYIYCIHIYIYIYIYCIHMGRTHSARMCTMRYLKNGVSYEQRAHLQGPVFITVLWR